MISKRDFVRYIYTLKMLDESSSMLDSALRNFDECPDFGGFSNFRATGLIIELLEVLMKDPKDQHGISNISYYVYELEYGSKWTPDCLTDSEGNSIDISSPEKLYDYIVDSSQSTI